MKRTIIYIACASLLTACGSAHQSRVNPEHGFETAGIGLGHLLLSPLMIVAGLLEGIAALPMLLGSGLHEINRELVAADAQITLDDVYRDVYNTPLEDVAADGDTGTLFREMRSATMYFQSMLQRQGVEDADRYLLTAVRTADKSGYTLYAVVRRSANTIKVRSQPNSSTARLLGPVDLDYYHPYEHDAQHRNVDEIVDWAGLPRHTIGTQKGQAILFNLAANSVLNGKRSKGYWRVEQRWMAGEFRHIAETRQNTLRARMGVS